MLHSRTSEEIIWQEISGLHLCSLFALFKSTRRYISSRKSNIVIDVPENDDFDCLANAVDCRVHIVLCIHCKFLDKVVIFLSWVDYEDKFIILFQLQESQQFASTSVAEYSICYTSISLYPRSSHITESFIGSCGITTRTTTIELLVGRTPVCTDARYLYFYFYLKNSQ